VDFWNALIVVSLIVAALAAVFVAVTTRIGFVRSKQLTAVQTKLIQAKDVQLAYDLKGKDERIAEANQLAAAAEERAAEANLALEQFKAPRTLTHDQQQRIAEKIRHFGAIPFDFAIQQNTESQGFMEQIALALKSGGWQRIGADAGISMKFRDDRPAVGIVNAIGIEIQMAKSKKSEWGAPAVALANALTVEGVVIAGVNAFEGPTDKAIHIIVGGKE
jgi:hypothetical protein